MPGTYHYLKSEFAAYQMFMRPGQLPPPSEVCQDTVENVGPIVIVMKALSYIAKCVENTFTVHA